MQGSWAMLAAYARRHHGTIGAHTARELGIPASSLRSWRVQGRLEQPAPEAYVIAGTPDSWRRRVAVATASSDGWASHRTSAALWQLDGADPRHIEVLTLHGRARDLRGWTVHETRRLGAVDLTMVDGIPCTTVARTILDLPAVAHAFVVTQALDSACRREPEMVGVIRQRFLELAGRGRKGTRLVRALLDERMGRGCFTQSGFETLTLKLVRSIGLPAPVLQHQVREGAFVAYLDLAWPRLKWGVECDSLAWHSGKTSHEWDRRRRRKLKQLGWDLVEITYDDVTKRRLQTASQLRDLYHLRAATIDTSGSAHCVITRSALPEQKFR